MKATLHNSLRLLIVCMSVCTFSACTVDTHSWSEQAAVIEATASSAPASSSSSSRSSSSNKDSDHGNGGLGGFVQVWSTSNPSSAVGDDGQQVSTQTTISAIYASQEYKQLRVMMNANNYERAKQIATTPTLKAIVEQEYRMHLEMLNTEQITAKADQVFGSVEL
ncbi:hypothetical protein [Undibacterium sp. Ji22W]|uniref:hypothetical protein n=1 Tax=Undibacterium sp. Ji22W TaxID=3413038 RepID=UPI003BF0B777